MSPDWPLLRAIIAELEGDDGLTDTELAKRLSVPYADVRQAARILYRQRKLDVAWGFNVLPVRAPERRRAA